MVTLAPPTLTPREAEILDAYFSARGDLAALAERLSLSAADLLAWRAAPAVCAALEALDALTDQADRFRLSHRRLAAIDALARVCRESDSLVEQRLAAIALLRGPSAPRSPRAPRPASPRDGASSHSPSRADRGRAGRGAFPHLRRAEPPHPEPHAARTAPRSRPATPRAPATPQSLEMQFAATQSPPPLPLSFSSLLDLPDLGPRSRAVPMPPRSPAALASRAGRADTS